MECNLTVTLFLYSWFNVPYLTCCSRNLHLPLETSGNTRGVRRCRSGAFRGSLFHIFCSFLPQHQSCSHNDLDFFFFFTAIQYNNFFSSWLNIVYENLWWKSCSSVRAVFGWMHLLTRFDLFKQRERKKKSKICLFICLFNCSCL